MRLVLDHVSTRWMSAVAQPGEVDIEDVVRGELARDGCRLAVVLEAFSVEPRTGRGELVELTVVDAVGSVACSSRMRPSAPTACAGATSESFT